MFWKTSTPFTSTTITLIEKEAIIYDDQKVTETLSGFFNEAVDKLNTRGCNNISNTGGYYCCYQWKVWF